MSTSTLSSISSKPVAHRALLLIGAAAEAMTFLEHLDELRRRILWSVLSVAAAFCVCWAFATDLYDLASAPIRANPAVTLAIARPQDIVSLHMKVALIAALFVAAPLVLLQAWLFIAPGLHAHEKRYAIPFVASGSLLFVAGGAFGYYIAFPTALTFLLDWTAASHLVPIIDAMEYFDLFFTIIVALGLVFQIPAVIFVLSRVGLVSARLLVGYFKHAVVACVVIAAVVTPTTDFGNLVIIAGPMIALYAVGIAIAYLFGSKR